MFGAIFAQSFAAHAQKPHFLLPVKFLTKNLKFSWPDSYSTTKFGGTCGKIYACLERKTAFVTQNLGNKGWEY